MKYLTNEHWAQFEKTVDQKIIKDGIAFERLIYDLLCLMYQHRQLEWRSTGKSHDDNRDFYAIDGEQLYWAECKNFSASLSLKSLAPTLIMAEIYGAQCVFFFSYSEINQNTKQKLCKYSGINKKRIRFFDHVALESLILSHGDSLLEKHFPSYKNTPQVDDEPPQIFAQVERDPLLYRKNGFSDCPYENIDELLVGDVVGYIIILINRSATKTYQIQISLEDDSYNFKMLDAKSKENKLKISIELPPCEASSQRIYCKLVRYEAEVILPKLTVRYKYADKSGKINYQFGTVKGSWSANVLFMGSSYHQLLSEFRQICIEKNHMTGSIFFGKSGTGKTRLLCECKETLLSYKYKVISFVGWEQESSSATLIKEILYILYELSDEIIDNIVTVPIVSLEGCDDNYRPALSLLTILHQNYGNLTSIDPEMFFPVYEKITNDRYAIIIDNLQYYDPFLWTFLSGLLTYGKNKRRKTRCTVLVTINTDLAYHPQCLKFLADFHSLSLEVKDYYLCRQITGFQTASQGLGFLKALLRLSDIKSDERKLVEILEKCSSRPKHIQEIAKYLVDFGAIKTMGDTAYLSDPARFYRLLEDIPKSFQIVFQRRWEYFLEKQANEEDYLIILSAVYLFGALNEELILALNIPVQRLKELIQIGVLEKKHFGGEYHYGYEHDLVKKFFIREYPGLLSSIDLYVNTHIVILQQNFEQYPIQKNYCLLSAEDIPEKTVIDIYQNSINESVPQHLAYYYYEKLLMKLLKAGSLTNREKLDACLHISSSVRDYVGQEYARNLHKKVIHLIRNIGRGDVSCYKEYFRYTTIYCENLIHLSEPSQAIDAYIRFISDAQALNSKASGLEAEINYQLAYVYNRMYVCGRKILDTERYEHYLKKSDQLCRAYGFVQIEIENRFDEARGKVCNPDGAAIMLRNYQKGCELYELHPSNYLEGNYHFHNIQVHLMGHQHQRLKSDFSNAFAYLDMPHVRFRVFFKMHFIHLKITAFIAETIRCSHQEVESLFSELEQLCYLHNPNQMYRTIFLKGKYEHQLKHYAESMILYHQAITKIQEIQPTKEHLKHKEIMEEDMAIKYRQCARFLPKNYEKNLIKDLLDTDLINCTIQLSEGDFDNFLHGKDRKATYISPKNYEGFFML